jgi:hypothetical protein
LVIVFVHYTTIFCYTLTPWDQTPRPISDQGYEELLSLAAEVDQTIATVKKAIDYFQDQTMVKEDFLTAASTTLLQQIITNTIPNLLEKKRKLDSEQACWEQYTTSSYRSHLKKPDVEGRLALHNVLADSQDKRFPGRIEFILQRAPEAINVRDKAGLTSLSYTLHDYDLMSVFLEHGADPNQPCTKNGLTPLMHLIESRHANNRPDDYRKKLIKLLTAGADPNLAMSTGSFSQFGFDLMGWTPLHMAVEYVDKEGIALLLNQGANKKAVATIVNTEGRKIAIRACDLAFLLRKQSSSIDNDVIVFDNGLQWPTLGDDEYTVIAECIEIKDLVYIQRLMDSHQQ